MAHAQKPDFVFRRNGRVHLNRRRRQFSRILAAELCASAVVMLDTPCSEVVWRVLATHSIYQFPPLFPLPCVTVCHHISTGFYRVFNLKVDRILIWVIYLLRFTTCYITQLSSIYSKCWKWCPFISMHLSTRFATFLATFLSVLSFTSSMARVIFIFKILNFSKNFVYSGRKTSFLNNFPK
jgi:hypothetical protein